MTILFDSNNLNDIFKVLFNLEGQQKVSNIFIEYLKMKRVISKSDLSRFADLLNQKNLNELDEYNDIKTNLNFEINIKYNRKQFYSRIIKPMLNMGLINLGYYDKKYRLSEEFIENLEKIKHLWQNKIQKQQI